MKLLEIKDKKGSFFNGKEHVDIKELTGDALLFLVDQIHKLDDILLDPVTEENLPDNVAREIYSHVYQKLDELIKEKSNIEANFLNYVSGLTSEQ